MRCTFFFFQAEDGIRDLVRSRGLGDVYKRQCQKYAMILLSFANEELVTELVYQPKGLYFEDFEICLLYTSDAADEDLV